ncbi:hypothetical protein [Amorphus sp. MBR-141]
MHATDDGFIEIVVAELFLRLSTRELAVNLRSTASAKSAARPDNSRQMSWQGIDPGWKVIRLAHRWD